MKLPKSFRPKKDLEEKTKELIEGSKSFKPITQGILQEDIFNGWKAYLDMREENNVPYVLCVYDHGDQNRYHHVNDRIMISYFNDPANFVDAWVMYDCFDEIDMNHLADIISDSEQNVKCGQVVYTCEKAFKHIMDDPQGGYLIDKMYYLHIYDAYNESP